MLADRIFTVDWWKIGGGGGTTKQEHFPCSKVFLMTRNVWYFVCMCVFGPKPNNFSVGAMEVTELHERARSPF
jgi:hypothetical protein